MFDNLLIAVKANISTIRSIIKTNEKMREIDFEDVSLYTEETKKILMNIFQDIPDKNNSRVYDQCAVVTRLYAIYESFVEDLIRDWLILLPSLYPDYSDLDSKIRNTHKNGVGRLLQEIQDEEENDEDKSQENKRYSHLSIEKVVQGLFDGKTGKHNYQLLPDAFLFHQQNLREGTLGKLLADAGIDKTGSWLVNHRDIKNFLKEIRGNQTTLEKELNILISYRNDAAHSTKTEDWLGFKPLLELCDFVESLCQALTELVTHQVIDHKTLIGQAQEVGKITRWYDKIQVAVLKASKNCLLSVGGSLFLVGDSYCKPAKIESIRNQDDESINEIETTPGMEVKLKFDIDARKNLCLYQLIT
ncbi:MAE_28990/MAE_18760 family HEPN-like nuclease [Dolichospermum flos-aquae]|jgi:hypothetical protein|uniref:RiboL-PSP-HEPN domain-containing protein n=1 Tax=Dolichospermum flos-aquae CCAP 1403/13F TaxID=315271 RepID=A0A6H2C5K3_DOLFA|nr:MAE_28990/MAE_18760 family HEPN-like nuclease [Dolichospermum flos-aquae]QJB46580.1 hypothetical protein HGD76_22740 [Dolichospermum flos-aquae CCAP 1403/13F]